MSKPNWKRNYGNAFNCESFPTQFYMYRHKRAVSLIVLEAVGIGLPNT
jgi:hypothetical protein